MWKRFYCKSPQQHNRINSQYRQFRRLALFSCILNNAICITNKRNLLKIKGKKVFNSKQVEGKLWGYQNKNI